MKKILLLLLSILLMLLAIGVTYSYFSWQSTNKTNITISTGQIIITFNGGSNVTGKKLIPVSTKEKGETAGTGVAKTFTVSSTQTAYMNVYLNLDTFPTALRDKSLVWELYNGTTKVSSGNFGAVVQGDSITLLRRQSVTTTSVTYKLYIWIDGTQTNPNTMQNQSFSFTLSATATDNSGDPNPPELVQGMIPIKRSGSNWVKADKTNLNNDWYDYDDKKWANAVLVSSSKRSTYASAAVGTTISESYILAYYVWIPKFRYYVFNKNKVIGTDVHNSQTKGVKILFNQGTTANGGLTCGTYSFAAATATTPNEVCTENTSTTFTHPAFKFGTKATTGFWVGKFELSSETPTAENGGGNVTTLTPRIKPNVISWRYNRVTNFFKVISDMQVESNIYGLSTDKTNTDSHLIKNLEWGAVAILAHSKYGRCENNTCTEVTKNASDTYTTGGGAYTTNLDQSTTGNIYGVYDMSGGSYEYVMGNMSSTTGSYTYYASSGGTNYTYSSDTAKYIDTYAYGESISDQTAFNRSRMGDMIGEIALTATLTGGWNGDYTYVVSNYNGETVRPWYLRGGNYSHTTAAGIFAANYASGGYGANISARAVLMSVK